MSGIQAWTKTWPISWARPSDSASAWISVGGSHKARHLLLMYSCPPNTSNSYCLQNTWHNRLNIWPGTVGGSCGRKHCVSTKMWHFSCFYWSVQGKYVQLVQYPPLESVQPAEDAHHTTDEFTLACQFIRPTSENKCKTLPLCYSYNIQFTLKQRKNGGN